MSLPKPASERSRRRGSENRQRQKGVSVRFSSGELGMLDETCRRMGESRAHLLRNGALAAMDLFGALKKAEALIEDRDSVLARVRALDSAAILIGGERYIRADYVREALEGDSDECAY